MFKNIKKMLGYEPTERKLIGNYFYYSNFEYEAPEYNDIEFFDIKQMETKFYLNIYETNSMRLEINSVGGKKFYDLVKHPSYLNNSITMELFDRETNIEGLMLYLNNSTAMFRFINSERGFVFHTELFDSDDSTNKTKVVIPHTDNETPQKINENTEKGTLQKINEKTEEIILLINKDAYTKDRLGQNIDILIQYIEPNQSDIDLYSNYLTKIPLKKWVFEILMKKLSDEDYKRLSLTSSEVDNFRKLYNQFNIYRVLNGTINSKGSSLKDLLKELVILKKEL